MKNIYFFICLTASFFCFNASVQAQWDIAKYQNQASIDNNKGRCVNKAIPTDKCHMRIDWAMREKLITARAAAWGKKNGFYPVIDFFDRTIGAICKCGCFEQNTLIRAVKDGVVSDVIAKELDSSYGLVALSELATLSDLSTEEYSMKGRTEGPETAALFVFTFDDGNQLKVTQHHGMLLGDGEMVTAKDVKVNDTMLSAEGSELKVVSIVRESTDDNVYNFETNGDTHLGHIIIANGIFVGDLTWQNQLQSDLYNVIVRQ